MSRLVNIVAGVLPFLALLPLSGCASRPDYALSPPNNTEWVTVAVKLPPETEALPVDVLYRSEICRRKDYDPTTESHIRTIRGFNPVQIPLSPPDNSGFRKVRIALDGGTRCGWTLSGVRVGIQISRSSALAQGKDVTAANYVFDFDDEGYGSAFGKGKPLSVSGDLFFKTEFFPMEYVYRSINEIDLDLFAGDEKYSKWNRYYRVTDSRDIKIEPVLYLNKVVKLQTSDSDRGKVIVTYPDGSSENIRGRAPDYDKLLRMK
ncbi:TPA: hypothetical protein L1528_004578 [Escherichia coli]|uniref:hypothetical protein n=1 Tax=Escherichia coli TaxID=562 RepID=UPI001FF52C8B|nr:hypothetical protein [Escherichia coli]EKG7251257.1 hypothetical protein [Escherichia coli]HBN1734534.1 hypothetical protein [Escherichia coli]